MIYVYIKENKSIFAIRTNTRFVFANAMDEIVAFLEISQSLDNPDVVNDTAFKAKNVFHSLLSASDGDS